MLGRRIANWPRLVVAGLSTSLFVFSVTLFLLPAWARIIEVGFCCADDAYFAMISRQFVETGEYGLPIAFDRVSIFEPAIGAGPAFIVPTSIAIRLFGLDPRVPGSVALALFFLPFLGFLALLARRYDTARALLYGAGSLVTIAALSQEQNLFGVNMGEAPTLGFLLLGCGVLALHGTKPWPASLAGLAFGLAILTKQAAVYPAFGACAIGSLALLVRHRGRGILPVIALAIGAVAPVILFEVIKLGVLGYEAYLSNWRAVLDMQRSFAVEPPSLKTPLDILAQRFGIGLSFLMVLAFSIALIMMEKAPRDPARRTLAALLLGAALATFVNFAASGFGSARYLWPTAMLAGALLPLPLLSGRLLVQSAILIAILAFVATPFGIWTFGRAAPPPDEAGTATERLEVVAYLNSHPDLPVYGQWWGSSFDIYFLLPADRPWFVSNDETEVGRRDAIYVAFSRFFGDEYPLGPRLRERCDRQLPTLHHFELYLCREHAMSKKS